MKGALNKMGISLPTIKMIHRNGVLCPETKWLPSAIEILL